MAASTKAHDHLPEALKRAIQQRRVLPVVGSGIPDFIPRSMLSWPTHRPRPDAEVVANWFEIASEHMLPLYETLTTIPCDCVLALTPDRHLAGLLLASDPSWLCVESSQCEIDEQRRLLIQLAGNTEHPSKLLLTEEDWMAIEERKPILWELARSHAARIPLLLLACDPSDEWLEDVISDLRPNRHFRPAGWLLCENKSSRSRERWEDRGFNVVSGPIADLLEELREAGASRGCTLDIHATRGATGRANPYKHLDYFERGDAPLFFGREKETRRLIDLVCAHRLVVVTGPSGTGKTSLLQAGLWAWSDSHPPFVCIYSRCGEDPEGSVTEAVRTALGRDSIGPLHDGISLLELLERFVERGQGIPVVILDQAEELFTRFDERLRQRFLVTIRTCLTTPNLPVRIVLSLRDDFLGRLVDLRNLLPSLLQNTFYVPPLTKEAALDAICKPCLLVGVGFDEPLAERIVDEIENQRIAPPQIQIVCDSLFRQRGEGGITGELYDQLGGARKILAEFMDQQLSRLAAQKHMARDILKAMVTSEGTKEVLSSTEVARRAKYKEEEVQRILFHLRDTCRLIRSITEARELRFELVHEYLTKTIWEWMSPEEKARREMEELLIKELRAWRQFHTIRFGLDPLRRFAQHSDVSTLDSEALTLLLLSCITHQYDATAWLCSAKALGDSVQDQIAARLFDYFQDADVNQRCEAAEVIAQLDPAILFRVLDSPSTRSRRVAIEMLGGIGLTSAVPRIARLLKDSDEVCRILACGALGAIGGQESIQILVEATCSKDMATACAALRAIGRPGIPESCYNTVLKAFTSNQAELVESAKGAIAYGQSPDAVWFLLNEKLSQFALDSLWKAVAEMPIECESWLQGVLQDLSYSKLTNACKIPCTNWVGWLAYCEKGRRRPSPGSGVPMRDIRKLLPPGVSVGVAAEVLQGEQRAAAIQELARRGKHVQPLLESLATNDSPGIRVAVLEILMQQGDHSDRGFTLAQITRMALEDKVESVRSTACQAASNLKLWSVIERVLRSGSKGKTRASALRALSDAPMDILISYRILRDSLAGSEPSERYWGCLLVKKRNLVELLDAVRALAWDKSSVASSWYYADKSWPYFDPEVGETVSHAAKATLAVLSPSSAAWRLHLDWQHSIRGPNPK